MKNFIKEYFKNTIKRMVKENEKSFGNGKLDCCDLNTASNGSKKLIPKTSKEKE
ncbi:LDCC motif putative metal-binding protein [Clostridium sp. MB40-C1]|uniref:LDCC motif putative metal-binding protein n=1 Tax=Clostridium sp. MB40-C1 TaxID=3070996 RepID=UPI0027DF4421|nr:LDCC motif putative metal-binding protein [Clostridium sp. MB40-C1]WMJ81840.1 LDCC motif putative metal-binding protein [Clostridium sp. MB40-C1]